MRSSKAPGSSARGTDLNQTQALQDHRLEQVFESSNDAIFIVDPGSADVIDCNPRAEMILGLSREAAVGRSLSEFLPEHSSIFHSLSESVLKEGAGFCDEFLFRTTLSLGNISLVIGSCRVTARQMRNRNGRSSQLTRTARSATQRWRADTCFGDMHHPPIV